MPEQVWWNSPGWLLILSLLVAFLGIMTGVIKLLFPKVDREKERAEAMRMARRIAKYPQRVTQFKVYPHPGMICIEVRADNDAMDEVGLFFSHTHPDAQTLVRTQRSETLRFSFHELPAGNVNKQDATAYLRLK